MLLYTALLLLLTQRLAVKRIVSTYQPLTTSHDECNAWNGLGSAFLTLWRQLRSVSVELGTLGVIIYLASFTVLHTTTPSLFSMQPFNDTSLTVTATGSMPTFLGNVSDINVLVNIVTYAWPLVYELLPFIAVARSQMTPGLFNNTLYDVLSKNNGVGEVQTNATSANVTCGFLPNATIQALEPGLVNTTTPFGVVANYWAVEAVYNSFNISLAFPQMLTNTVIQISSAWTLGGSGISTNCPQGRDILFAVSANVTDSHGAFKGSVELPNDYPLISYTTPFHEISLMGCTLSWSQQTALVNAQTNELVSLEPGGTKLSSIWNPWEPTKPYGDCVSGGSSDPINFSLADQHVDLWAAMMNGAPEWRGTGVFYGPEWLGPGVYYGQEVFPANSSESELQAPTVDFRYLMQTLNLTPGEPVQTTLTLDQFENGLANLTASLYWAESSFLPNMRSYQIALQEIQSENQTPNMNTSSGNVIAAQLAARLNLNILPLSIGLAASFVLLVLSIPLTRGKRDNDDIVQSLGILDLAWLVSNQYELRETVGRVKDPTVENLRAAGMTPVTLVRRKIYEESEYMGLDSG
ncbi:uncharacterized protein FIBRA_01296 [Fibroporia radiculosa]|uniref:Uncharacterized protein n=1 Tax=Fibroporia radiculosa TaxID=599839 RepID=J4I8E7_9APHY|nr:uncharacterized protein FIBRA_01296 [Fibroporia radiculosa]CCL99281.1 predicted protein [Fibroporia radiculosa]